MFFSFFPYGDSLNSRIWKSKASLDFNNRSRNSNHICFGIKITETSPASGNDKNNFYCFLGIAMPIPSSSCIVFCPFSS